MKIYSRKLTNLSDLKAERLKLKQKLNSNNEHSGEEYETPKEKENFISGLLSGVTSGSLLTTVFNVAPTVYDFISKRKSVRSKAQKIISAKTSKPNIIVTAATEFIGGYIKWKIIELTYKGVKTALKSDTAKEVKRNASKSIKNVFQKKK